MLVGVVMQLSTRASLLRSDVERAVRAAAEVTAVAPGRVRITAPVSGELTILDFQNALKAVQRGDDWGSSFDTGAVVLWTEVHETDVP